MKKTCIRCGANALINDSFCMECGGSEFKSIEGNIINETSNSTEFKNNNLNQNEGQEEVQDDKLSNKTYYVIFGIIFIIFISLWFYRSKSISDQNKKVKIYQDSISIILLKDSIAEKQNSKFN
ncbi:hypothetical protein [Flavobacterium sp. XS1P27]|uniref:hypothetical protein n=1 Tax=Flavobacterium sp. XS1P27 TaxID=3401724 RepID=UPI003AAA4A1A